MKEIMSATKTQALLEEVREKLGDVTDYKIGKLLEIPRQRVSDYHKGTWQADAYACTKFAEVLARDPLEIIAQVEAEAAKTEKRREYWRNFPSGLKRIAAGFALFGICGISANGLQAGNAEASPGLTSHNVYLR